MTTAFYESVQDTEIELPDPSTGDIDRDIAFSTSGADTSKNAVLTFEVDPFSGSPTVEIAINGSSVYTRTFTVHSQRVVQENFPQSILTTSNTLTLTVTGGSAKVGDFCVHYKKA
jgi:hypothetical protein